MKGRVESGELVTVAPCNPDDLQINDIVLVKVKGKVYLHLIKAFGDNKSVFLLEIIKDMTTDGHLLTRCMES